MSRYIDADALGIGKADRNAFTIPEYADGWNSAIEIIANAPTADVAEVRHGYWVRDSHREEAYCSLCDGITPVDCEKELFYESDYCPSCGAKMDGERREK